MTVKRILATVVFCGLIAACSSFGPEDHQRSGTIKPMEIPEGMTAVELPPLYPIPDVKVREEAFYNVETDGFVVPRPEPMSAERDKAKVKIQKVGDRRWILAEAPTSQIWPLAQNFLMQYDMGTSLSNPGVGLVVTDWVVFNDSPDTRNQFKLRIEQGVRADTTEIHVLERTSAKNQTNNPDWSDESDQSEREEWLLMELANSLAGNIDNRAASLLGQSVGGQIKAELYMDKEEPALLLRLDRQRAWATLANAVTNEELFLWDEDSERGVLYIQSEQLVPHRPWYLRLFVGEYTDNRERPYPLKEVLTHLEDAPAVHSLFASVPQVGYDDKVLSKGQGLLVVMQKSGDYQVVKLRDFAGRLLPLQDNKKYLSIIRRHLI